MTRLSNNGRANYSVPEPPPLNGDRPSIHDLVIADIEDRKRFGREKYGTTLQAGNGRRSLVDAYQKVLDLAVYIRQYIEEHPVPASGIHQQESWQSSDIY